MTKPRAMATRCFIPAEICDGKKSLTGVKPVISSTSATRSLISLEGTLLISRPIDPEDQQHLAHIVDALRIRLPATAVPLNVGEHPADSYILWKADTPFP